MWYGGGAWFERGPLRPFGDFLFIGPSIGPEIPATVRYGVAPFSLKQISGLFYGLKSWMAT